MAVVTPAIANNTAGLQYNAAPVRRAFMTLLRTEQDGVSSMTDWVVTQRAAGANMSVDISEGRGIVKGDDNAYQAAYVCESQGVTNLAIAASHPSLGRIDLIVARVRDNEYGIAGNSWAFETIQGTPASSPAVPANVNSSYVIGQVYIGPGVTSILDANIDDLRIDLGISGHSRLQQPIGARVRRAATQTGFTALAWTAVSWDTEDEDSYGYSNVPGTTLSVPTGLGGPHVINAWVNQVSASEYIKITAAGRDYKYGPFNNDITIGPYIYATTGPIVLAAGDSITCSCYNASGTQSHTAILEVWRLSRYG